MKRSIEKYFMFSVLTLAGGLITNVAMAAHHYSVYLPGDKVFADYPNLHQVTIEMECIKGHHTGTYYVLKSDAKNHSMSNIAVSTHNCDVGDHGESSLYLGFKIPGSQNTTVVKCAGEKLDQWGRHFYLTSVNDASPYSCAQSIYPP